jgi:hypothetical protein
MKFQIQEVLAGASYRSTWVNSGQTPTSIWSALYDKAEALVSSRAGVSSGNGFYYADHTLPSSRGAWYVDRWYAVLTANTYISPQFVKAVWPEVD